MTTYTPRREAHNLENFTQGKSYTIDHAGRNSHTGERVIWLREDRNLLVGFPRAVFREKFVSIGLLERNGFNPDYTYRAAPRSLVETFAALDRCAYKGN